MKLCNYTYIGCMYLQEDFEDEVKATEKDDTIDKIGKNAVEQTSQTKSESVNATSENKTSVNDSTIFDLLDIATNEPSETDCLLDIFSNAANSCKPIASAQSTSNILTFDFLKKYQNSMTSTESNKKGVTNKPKMGEKKTSAWMDLFADLDPLANPTTMEKKIAGLNQNCLDA